MVKSDQPRLVDVEFNADELEAIRAKAKIRHEKARKAARKRGRIHFPDLPYECSWGF